MEVDPSETPPSRVEKGHPTLPHFLTRLFGRHGPTLTIAPQRAAAPPAGPEPNRTRVFDPDEALENTGGDETFLGEVVRIWLGDEPRRLTEIRDGVAASDSKAIERAAHRIRGSLGTLAAGLATEAADRVEMLAAGGELSTIAEAVAVLEAEVVRLRPHLEHRAERSKAA